MKYNLVSKYDRQKLLDDARRLVDKGEKAELDGKVAFGTELKALKPPQSNQQLRYAFVCIGYLAASYGMSKYEAEWDHFKNHANHDLFYKTKLNRFGKPINYVRHMDELDMGEMSLAITRFHHYVAENFDGLYIPSSCDWAFMLHAEKVIEENKEFL